jgi:hypothetical protein
MDNTFFAYIQRLESMAFFSGYPLFYVAIVVIAGNYRSKNNLQSRIVSLLPYAYALVGTLYLGLQLKNFYPDYSFYKMQLILQQPYLTIWGLLAMLFWIPAFAKKPFFSLLHSLIFFFFLVRDLFLQLSLSSVDKNIIRNDMKLYTDSILLNLGALAFILLISYLYTRYKRRLNYRSGN